MLFSFSNPWESLVQVWPGSLALGLLQQLIGMYSLIASCYCLRCRLTRFFCNHHQISRCCSGCFWCMVHLLLEQREQSILPSKVLKHGSFDHWNRNDCFVMKACIASVSRGFVLPLRCGTCWSGKFRCLQRLFCCQPYWFSFAGHELDVVKESIVRLVRVILSAFARDRGSGPRKCMHNAPTSHDIFLVHYKYLFYALGLELPRIDRARKLRLWCDPLYRSLPI